MKIGVFDSGFGGLSVFKAIRAALPQYEYLYLADNARAPYGNHSHEVIYGYVQQAVQYLFDQDCVLVVLACNTASAQALRRLQQDWLPKHYPDRRVLGVIRPIAEAVAQTAAGKTIGIIGTRATIGSHAYKKEIEKLAPDVGNILEEACPLLVPLIEEGWHKRPQTKMILRQYLRPLKLAKINVLVNGCTHYELIRKDIVGIMGKRVQVIDSPAVVAASLAEYLQRHADLEARINKGESVRFLTTDQSARFDQLATMFYRQSVQAERVVLPVLQS